MPKRRMTAWERILATPPKPRWPTGPEQHSLVVGGRLCVSVRLHGKHGHDQFMILEEIDWNRVRVVLGERWTLRQTSPNHVGYVAAYSTRAKAHAGGGQVLLLARWIMKAQPGEVVCYRDGDPLNLVRINLEVIPKGGLVAWMNGRQDALRREMKQGGSAGLVTALTPPPCDLTLAS